MTLEVQVRGCENTGYEECSEELIRNSAGPSSERQQCGGSGFHRAIRTSNLAAAPWRQAYCLRHEQA